MSNPYAALPYHHFWRRAVAGIEAHRLDPVVRPKFTIDSDNRVATAGSCFAQHISKQLGRIGFNYFVPEDGAGLGDGERAARHYGTFSARFGNIYTTAQLLQLFEEAFGRRTPTEIASQRVDGRWVDMLRPTVEPEGYDAREAVLIERECHLAHVRAMFEQAGTLIFTLGLTEAWRLRADGTVLPLAPGVVAGSYDPAEHEFVNFDVAAVSTDLGAFLAGLKAVNPAVNVLLTVSPVPLIATFEDQHVLVATTYSKSVLRVAAEAAVRANDWVDYFPSYEIITGSFAGGLYYEEDAREVNRRGVAHAMRCFVANYAAGERPSSAQEMLMSPPTHSAGQNIVCDEEMLDAARV